MSVRRKVGTAVFVHRATSRGHHPSQFNVTSLQSRYEEKRTMFRSFGPNLQVQGFGCPLQQRPGSSGQSTLQRPSSQTTTKPDQPNDHQTSLLLLTNLKGKLETRVIPALRSRTGTRTGLNKGDVPCISNSIISQPEIPMMQCKTKVQPGSVPELHLYLPSPQCEEEEDDDGQEIRTCAESTSPQESEVNALLPNPSCSSEDQAIPGPSSSPQCPPPSPPDDITLDIGLLDPKQPPVKLQKKT